MRKIEIIPVISEGFQIGMKNFVSIFVAVLLWLLTFWVPYINVGTTIAILSLPVALSKGEGILSPLFIFESKYRRYMGEFFTVRTYVALYLPGIIVLHRSWHHHHHRLVVGYLYPHRQGSSSRRGFGTE